MNRIEQLFNTKKNDILSVYFTAGYPNLPDTLPILKSLQQHGADMVEIGMPFSDPLADGPVIQKSSQKALLNGMSLKILLNQLREVRKEIHIPLLLMGYLNPVMQYGMEAFLKDIAEAGIDGLILPDLPLDVYVEEYKPLFEKHSISNILLITPQSSEERIRNMDTLGSGFLYMVSTAATTGTGKNIFDANKDYFYRVEKMNLRLPRLIGFGIHDHKSFSEACRHSSGAIIGTAFIKALENGIPVADFIRGLK